MALVDSQKITAEIQQEIGRTSKELIQQIYTGMDAWTDASILPDVKNEMRLTEMFIADLVKPFKPEFDPTADALEFKPRTISVKTGKAELRFVPEEYRSTYLAQFMRPGMARSPEDMPFARYILDDIVRKVADELNNVTAYNGVYNAAGTSAVDVADGWGTKLAAMIADATNPLAPTVQGTYTAADGYTKALALARGVPERFLTPNSGLVMFMSLKTYWAIQDQIATLNLTTGRGFNDETKKWLPTMEGIVEMRPVSWMNGSDRVFITPQRNIVIAADATQQDLASIHVIPEMWSAQLGIGFAIGFDFRTQGLIWLNDAA